MPHKKLKLYYGAVSLANGNGILPGLVFAYGKKQATQILVDQSSDPIPLIVKVKRIKGIQPSFVQTAKNYLSSVKPKKIKKCKKTKH